jgi:hypothetical protein
MPKVILTPDEGYLLVGTSYSPASGDKSENSKGGSDYWVVKIDAQGNKVWDSTIGGNDDDYLYSAIPITENTYLLSGTSHSPASADKSEDNKGNSDYWIVKLKDQSTPVVTSLTLMDAATDQEIKELKKGDVINLSEAGNGLFSIRANTSGPIDQVTLKLQGPVKYTRTEKAFPYALFGDIEGDYGGRALPAGKYTLTATPFNQRKQGIALTVSFEVTEPLKISRLAPESDSLQVAIYPVPTSDVLQILHEGKTDQVQLMLLDFGGNILLHQPLGQQPVDQLKKSGLRKGIYYLKIISPEEVQVFRVVKE